MQRFLHSDPHFLHDRIYQFTDEDGERVRPWAENSEEADELMIEAWNAVVPKNGATVYCLGDVAMKAKGLHLLSRMNGRKILIRGNHDIFRLKQYTDHFADIRGTHKLDRLILSHYPIHPDSIPHWCDANVHGHTHDKVVTRRTWYGRRVPDTRYINVCVERIGLTPVPVEDIAAQAAALRGRSE
jgi:calcineurin-like phosphoesterase family protein